MRAEDTLQIMADLYTSIFPTRKRAIHFLFCVVGNGYHWQDGELICGEDDKLNRWELKTPIKKAKFMHDDDWPDSFFDQPEIIYSEVKEWNKYAHIFNAPDNVKDDWHGLMEECREYARKDGVEIPAR